ncbi:MAG: alpha/beta fold hydrolase [Thermomicrobiales bacterium]|nr:alpha/beta fold hydrolase [Thermomicrobiales bacterium]
MPTSSETQLLPFNHADLAYDVTGSGPVVLLLHAGLGDRTMWDAQVPALANEFTVVRLDARGFGETRKPPVAYSSVEDVLAILDHLGVERAHVVGVSMGSQAAIELAVAAPGRVESLVAVAARTGVPVSPELRAGWDHVDALVEAGDIDGAVEYELRMWIDGPQRTPDMIDPTFRERVREMNGALFLRDDDEGEEIALDPPAAERLGEVAAPTLVLCGDQDIADVQQAGPLIARVIPGAQLAVLPNASHLPQMEHPERFNDILLGFLRGVSARA